MMKYYNCDKVKQKGILIYLWIYIYPINLNAQMDVSVASNMKYSVYQSMLSFSVINNPEWYARSYQDKNHKCEFTCKF